ncbi:MULTISPECIES: nucleotide-binding domain-containing protein [unclassified Pseudomonas]|uniref:nucleotide-binding domain-containing protein n=1 Tax=unclassified Pseudomonas TaxID=196821 RepID=UPI0010F66BAA|nr:MULTISPECIES: adenylate/guanylate cyclase domain-containing protein [unclassified Pseudomonas]
MSTASKDAFRSIINKARSKPMMKSSHVVMDGIVMNESRSLPRVGEVHEHALQTRIRPQFGKGDINRTVIGCHPDFKHLEGTADVEYHHVCSLFLDIKNSTRLSFIYTLEEVSWIKNSILKAASEVVRSLDGYVHRFMGDAVLAFFGNHTDTEDDTIANALNCAAVLESLMVGTIIPVLVEEGYEARDLGFRIGLDYGSNQEVLWASYGYSEVCEVTPTSFYVDVAAKLQAMARKNCAMLGDNLLSKIDFPTAFVDKKVRMENGESVEVNYLDKIYTDRDGNKKFYKVRELNNRKYRDLLPFDPSEKATFDGSRAVGQPHISYKCYVDLNGQLEEYRSVSRFLPKFSSLQFRLVIQRGAEAALRFPLVASFTKYNHGHEAATETSAGIYPKGTYNFLMKSQPGLNSFYAGERFDLPESTKYRGLHCMEVEVKDSLGVVVFRDTIGVYIC